MTAYFLKMANPGEQPSANYLTTLLRYYEEEIAGEAYFYALADHFHEKEKTILLARVERRAAESIQPLLAKYGLEPRSESILNREGRNFLDRHKSCSWPEFMAYIVDRYPGYVDDFRALEQMAPIADLPALNTLTDHEIRVIDFARKEITGDPQSLVPLHEYLV
jgi:dimethylamine/trimethylamine dehydrogenase